MNNIKQIIEQMEKADNILLSSHLSPDGDNIGSLIGLGYSLKEYGKKVTILELDEIPKKLKFIKGIESMSKQIPDNIDLYITLDCANKSRLGNVETLFQDSSVKILNIDHHKSNEFYGDFNYVKEEYSSTCEVVYEILKMAHFPFPQETVDALYTGLCTDTGRFLYPAATSSSFEMAADLLQLGANKRFIMYNLFENESLNAIRMKIDILSNTKFYCDDHVAISIATLEQSKRFNIRLYPLAADSVAPASAGRGL